MKNSILIICIFCLPFSCSEKQSFPYEQGLTAYMNDFFQEDLKNVDDVTLVFVYLEYCRSCVTDVLGLIDSVQNPKENLKLYLIGDPKFYPENEEVLRKIKRKFTYAQDVHSNHYSYITGINEPLILRVRNGDIQDYSYINVETMVQAKEALF